MLRILKSQGARLALAAALGAAPLGAVWLTVSSGDDEKPRGGRVRVS